MGDNPKLEEIAHEFDLEFYARQKVKMGKVIKRFIDLDSSPINGADKILEIQKHDPESVFIYASDHKSHVDYLFLGFKFFDSGLRPPRYAAGTNMFLGPLNDYWKKLGAFSVDRKMKNSREYLKALDDYAQSLVLCKNDILLFPEGGRSYSGAFGSLKVGLMGAAVSAQEKDPGLNVYVVPVTVAYDRVVEDFAFAHLSDIKDKNDSSWKKFRYYLEDASRFIGKALLEPNGKGYIHVGEPFKIKDMISDSTKQKSVKGEICDRVLVELKENYPILSTAVVCRMLDKNKDKRIKREDLETQVSGLIKNLETGGYNLDHLPKDPKIIVDYSLSKLGDWRIGHIGQKDGYVYAKNPKIVGYYSNSISFIDEANI